MTNDCELLHDFIDWAERSNFSRFGNTEIDRDESGVENIDWLKLIAGKSISGVMFWNTGDFYCEILTLESEDPVLCHSGFVNDKEKFDQHFKEFIETLESIESVS